jgi:hypothetical protein
MKGLRKSSAGRARHGKVFPATMMPTKSLWNLSGGGAGVVAVCGAIVVAVCGVTVVVAVCGVTDSTVAGRESLQHGAVRFLMLIGH